MSVRAPSTEKGRQTRARIVGVAAELVAAQGALATSLDDVGVRAQVSRSQLYHYFDNKADLLCAVVDATCDGVLSAQNELFEHLDTWAGIRRWMDALVAAQVARAGVGGCPIGSLAGQLAERDPHARTALANGLGRWEEHLRTGLEGLKARGALRPTADPAALATATIALLQGGLLLTQLRRDPQQLQIALSAALRLLRAEAT
jgi:AcrR family transcriptional regulator